MSLILKVELNPFQNHLSFSCCTTIPPESGILFQISLPAAPHWFPSFQKYLYQIRYHHNGLPMAPDIRTAHSSVTRFRNCKILHSLRLHMAFFHPFCTAILLLTDNHHRSVYPPQTIFRKAADIRPPVPENSFLPAGLFRIPDSARSITAFPSSKTT